MDGVNDQGNDQELSDCFAYVLVVVHQTERSDGEASDDDGVEGRGDDRYCEEIDSLKLYHYSRTELFPFLYPKLNKMIRGMYDLLLFWDLF